MRMDFAAHNSLYMVGLMAQQPPAYRRILWITMKATFSLLVAGHHLMKQPPPSEECKARIRKELFGLDS